MRIVSAIARYMAGVIFLVFGLNGFLNFIPLPPPGGVADSSWEPCMPRIICG
jgi:putative oxidoreductase